MCLLRGTDWVFIYRQFNIQPFYVLPTQCIYVFCVDLRTNSDYFPIQHWLTGFYNRDGVCLLRGTDWIFIYFVFNQFFRGFMYILHSYRSQIFTAIVNLYLLLTLLCILNRLLEVMVLQIFFSPTDANCLLQSGAVSTIKRNVYHISVNVKHK